MDAVPASVDPADAATIPVVETATVADEGVVIDVRDHADWLAGHAPGAINIPIDALEDSLDELPKGRPIVFFCTSGARSGDAYDLIQEKKLPIEAYFLDANVKFDKDGNYRLEEN